MDRVERTREYVVDAPQSAGGGGGGEDGDQIDGSFEEIMRNAVGIKQSMVRKRRLEWERAPEFFKHTMTSTLRNSLDDIRARALGLPAMTVAVGAEQKADDVPPLFERIPVRTVPSSSTGDGGQAPTYTIAASRVRRAVVELLRESREIRTGRGAAMFASKAYRGALDAYIRCLSLFVWFEKPREGQEEIHLREMKSLLTRSSSGGAGSDDDNEEEKEEEISTLRNAKCAAAIDREVSTLFLNIAACLLKQLPGSGAAESRDDHQEAEENVDEHAVYIVNGDELKAAMFACNQSLEVLDAHLPSASGNAPPAVVPSSDDSDEEELLRFTDDAVGVLVSKAYFRRAACRIEEGSSADLEIAIADLRHALRHAPETHAPSIRSLLRRTAASLRERNVNDRRHFGGMFARGEVLYSDAEADDDVRRERMQREATFTFDPTLPLSYEAQRKAVVMDNHNLNNKTVREHIFKLWDEEQRKAKTETARQQAGHQQTEQDGYALFGMSSRMLMKIVFVASGVIFAVFIKRMVDDWSLSASSSST